MPATAAKSKASRSSGSAPSRAGSQKSASSRAGPQTRSKRHQPGTTQGVKRTISALSLQESVTPISSRIAPPSSKRRRVASSLVSSASGAFAPQQTLTETLGPVASDLMMAVRKMCHSEQEDDINPSPQQLCSLLSLAHFLNEHYAYELALTRFIRFAKEDPLYAYALACRQVSEPGAFIAAQLSLETAISRDVIAKFSRTRDELPYLTAIEIYNLQQFHQACRTVAKNVIAKAPRNSGTIFRLSWLSGGDFVWLYGGPGCECDKSASATIEIAGGGTYSIPPYCLGFLRESRKRLAALPAERSINETGHVKKYIAQGLEGSCNACRPKVKKHLNALKRLLVAELYTVLDEV